MEKLKAVILAAGQGTRMQSKLPKVLHKIMDKTLLEYAIEAAVEAGAEEVCVVIGHKSELVKEKINNNVEFVIQKEQLGTGHAVMQAKEFIGKTGKTFILFGDTPLITGNTLKDLIEKHDNNKNSITVLTTKVDNPKGYGRIIRDSNGAFVKSVEEKDATEDERKVNEINSGMYIYNSKVLYETLDTLTNDNAQGEYYLPDTLKAAIEKGYKVDGMSTDLSSEILGVNSRVQLAEAQKIMQLRINEYWMEQGVTIVDPNATYISKDVKIKRDTIIYPNTIIEGKTTIGEDCTIGLNTRISNSIISDGCTIEQTVIIDSEVGNNTSIGPFAYLRPNSKLGNNVKIGDFVEIKNSTIGDGTKASHLTYIGDALVGKNVNFGCGTITVNHDGKKKHQTIIEDNVFIGCNTNLISPVRIRNNAFIAAGSTINKEIPPYSLGISRVPQENKKDWVKKNR
ncbi:UDP-N-acetylglucosamine pyrophosphorylase /glucosamine-1-phosphate N-acetyltransferase [Natranaerovirga pectinivora]|uniref:Bifunctional protein GlmU n=1 Tax=Natranaerovirga pectinivora TaxID=682400 RepID=A0A4R3MGW3_9FIRM|nr:bifunctional UDP-N-acetylglucosamine diphosphorylase/glucosamine-1-phosphate N-acetyltransferase GlmU [Natranaerovirga pectinivora]TCT13061.1 UDP-N-acetylglucosamine pyrophosphorylase /glucosamine-1-phosphate N-acetyltransferase [Natranaerovirga pectinivora]